MSSHLFQNVNTPKGATLKGANLKRSGAHLFTPGSSPTRPAKSLSSSLMSTSSLGDGIDASNMGGCLDGLGRMSPEPVQNKIVEEGIRMFDMYSAQSKINFSFGEDFENQYEQAIDNLIAIDGENNMDMPNTFRNFGRIIFDTKNEVTSCRKTLQALLEMQSIVNSEVIGPLSKMVPELANLMTAKKTPSRIRTNRMETFERAWAKHCADLPVVCRHPVQSKLKDYTRKQIHEYIIKMQDTEWQEPMYHNKGLKTFLRMYMMKYFKLVDEPNTVGLVLSQLLWPRKHFHTHCLPAFHQLQSSTQSTSRCASAEKNNEGRNTDKLPVERGEGLLWNACFLYIGGHIYEKAADDGKNMRMEYARKARENVNHRGRSEAIDPVNQKVRTYMPARFVPLFCRGADWDDADKYKDKVVSELDECLELLEVENTMNTQNTQSNPSINDNNAENMDHGNENNGGDKQKST